MLQLKTLGIDNLHKFEWLSAPPAEAMIRALELLHALGALDDDARYVHTPFLLLNIFLLDASVSSNQGVSVVSHALQA
jgi:ATP-dependent RNA helicase DDX35